MIGQLPMRPPVVARPLSASDIASATWTRRLVEVLVSALAFAVWGKLAYIGFFRLAARAQELPIGGHWVLDVVSLAVGVSGSIAGASALWALAMRALGRTPSSLVGAPDDSPEDWPRRTAEHAVASPLR